METETHIDHNDLNVRFQTKGTLAEITSLAPDAILKAVVDSVAKSVIAKYGDELEEAVMRAVSPEAIATIAHAVVTEEAGKNIAQKIQEGTFAANRRYLRKYGLG